MFPRINIKALKNINLKKNYFANSMLCDRVWAVVARRCWGGVTDLASAVDKRTHTPTHTTLYTT